MKTKPTFKQTEIGPLPEDWEVSSLGEISESISDTERDKSKEVIFLNTGDVLEGRVINKLRDQLKNLPGQAKKRIKKNDILFSEIRPANKRYAFIDFDPIDYIVSTKLMVLRSKQQVLPRYLCLFLTSSATLLDFQALAESRSGTFPQITFDAVASYSVLLPPLPTQRRIAEILSSLDDKIELNRKMNKTLESIAQAIFKHWFVDFEFPAFAKASAGKPNKVLNVRGEDITGKSYKSSGGKMVESELGMVPEGWGIDRVGNLKLTITDYVANGSFASLKENVRKIYEKPEYALFIRNTDLKNNFSTKRYVDKHAFEFLSKTHLAGGEVIISNVADVGSVYKCPYFKIPMVLGNNVIMINGDVLNSYIYLLFKSDIGQFLISSITSGSAQLKFNKTDFRNLEIINPTDEILARFNIICEDIFQNIQNNHNQIGYLGIIRDSLLPRLMSGRVRV